MSPMIRHLHSAELSFTGMKEELQFGLTRPGEASDVVPVEEAPFRRILCRISTDLKLKQNRLVGLRSSRRSKMVCNFVLDQLFQKGNGEKELRFHRILRESSAVQKNIARRQNYPI